MKKIRFILIILSTILSTRIIQASGEDIFKDKLSEVESPEIPMIFQENPEKTRWALEIIDKKKDLELVVLEWILELSSKFPQLDSKMISIDKLKDDGAQNDGVFKIKDESKTVGIIKIANCRDIQKLLKLRHVKITHPEILAMGLADYTPTDFVKIANVLDAARVGKKCLQFQEVANGAALLEFIDSSDSESIFYSVGKKLSLLNSFGWEHEDLHANNIFYDSETKQVTLIDNDDLEFYGEEASPSLPDFILSFESEAIPAIQKKLGDIAEESIEIDSTVAEALGIYATDKLKRKKYPEWLARFSITPGFHEKIMEIDKLKKYFRNDIAFVTGYIEAVLSSKSDRKIEIKSQLLTKCKRICEKFLCSLATPNCSFSRYDMGKKPVFRTEWYRIIPELQQFIDEDF